MKRTLGGGSASNPYSRPPRLEAGEESQPFTFSNLSNDNIKSAGGNQGENITIEYEYAACDESK
jgi:hypothetical protein